MDDSKSGTLRASTDTKALKLVKTLYGMADEMDHVNFFKKNRDNQGIASTTQENGTDRDDPGDQGRSRSMF